MRLFTAVEFSPANREALRQRALALQEKGLGGRTPRAENYHLTLVFLGESQNPQAAAAAMEQAAARCQPFTLKTGAYGCFRRSGGHICWLGVEPDKELLILQRLLLARLREQGFRPEDRPYRPHITLLRQAQTPADFPWRDLAGDWPGLTQPVRRIVLMQSSRAGDQLRYTPLAYADLGREENKTEREL
ncbi:MAG: RNA 2',3'-cyclic phosphodiesterase [Firmicutes bacterium]|nr:RNA 2',3'-cyclic phosphodiesterase [Bacillota bacterium]